jgi:O-acetyl-ADP-ribose deacetylase (regulator of RNase III)
MQLLSEITINGPVGDSRIQLLQGDLTALPQEHNADILVISAFPNDYTPMQGSLMYALHEKGIDVAALAKDKSVNLVQQLGCWLSKPLSKAQQDQFNFKQILCFEPSEQAGSPETAVGNIFRCINNFIFDDDNNVIAMPVLASGKQQVPIEKMLPAMLDASIFWLETGIPLDCIKLVVYRDVQSQAALPLFNMAKTQYALKRSLQQGTATKKEVANILDKKSLQGKAAEAADMYIIKNEIRELANEQRATDAPVSLPQAPPSRGRGASPAAAPQAEPAAAPPNDQYDFFISYSHTQTQQVGELVNALKAKNGQLNIFYDRSSIPAGGLWIKQISDAIQKSNAVICILSPAYRNSDVCWDEFQCAKAKEYRTKKSVIKTINFLKDDEMPLIMSIYSYIDCTEGDLQKLKAAVDALF